MQILLFKNLEYWLFTGFVALLIGVLVAMGLFIPILVAVIGSFALVFGVFRPFTVLRLTLVLFPFGELAKIPGNIPLLLNDMLVGWTIISYILNFFLVHKMKKSNAFSIQKVFLVLYIWIAFSIVANVIQFGYTANHLLVGISYAVRFLTYSLMMSVIAYEARIEERKQRLIATFFQSFILMSLIGLMQVFIFPDMTTIAKLIPGVLSDGYDPHIGRLVGTMFDPNLFSATLILPINILFSWMYSSSSSLSVRRTIVYFIILVIADLLTFSRGGLLTCGVGLLLSMYFFRFRNLKINYILIFLMILSPLILSSSRLVHRMTGIISGSYIAYVGPLTLKLDGSAYARYLSWNQALTVIKYNPIAGVGFDFIQYAKVRDGLVSVINGSAAANFDASLLDVTAMLGVVGLVLYLLSFMRILRISARISRFQLRDRALHFGILSGIIALCLDSFTTDSLFFVFVMESIFVWLGLSVSTKKIPEDFHGFWSIKNINQHFRSTWF